MSENIVFDTNVIIDCLNKKTGALDIKKKFADKNQFVSIINKLELLGFAKIKTDEEMRIKNFLPTVTIMQITKEIENETIAIRRQTKLKLPDSIIAATAIVLGAELVTTDSHLSKCTYPRLSLWKDL
jgi:predicted nucleic acid-binding protein